MKPKQSIHSAHCACPRCRRYHPADRTNRVPVVLLLAILTALTVAVW